LLPPQTKDPLMSDQSNKRDVPKYELASLPAKFEIVDAPVQPRTEESRPGYPNSPSAEDIDDEGGLLEYWHILRRRKGTLIIGATLGLLAGVLVTLPQTPIYQARATVEIQSFNQNFMNMQNVQQTVETSGWDGMVDVQTQIKVLESDTLIERVQNVLGAAKPTVAAKQDATRISTWRRALNLPDAPAEDVRLSAIDMAAGSLRVRASGQTRIVEILADSTDQKVAADFVNTLTSEFIDQSMEARWQSSQRTGEWLTRQLDEMRIKLERSEDALQGYAQRNSLLFTGKDTNVDEEKLKQIQDQLTTVQGDRVNKQSRWEMARTAPAESLPDVLNDSSIGGYQEKLADLNRQKGELLETFTPDSQRAKRVEAQIVSLEKSLDRGRGQILRRIRNEYEEAMQKERLLKSDYDKQIRRVTVLGEKAIQYNILKREVETNRGLYESMLQRVKEAGLQSALRANNVRIVDKAKPPEAPYKPRMPLNALLGLLGGGFLAVAFVVTTERADRALKDPSDIGFYLGVRELGVVPAGGMLMAKKRRKLLGGGLEENKSLVVGGGLSEKIELVTLQRRLSSVAESFRATLTSILFSGNGKGAPRMIVVTSASPGEGKTTVAVNLAIAAAETGQRVLLIDADTRKPRVHDVFEVLNEGGLTGALRGEKWEEMLKESGVPGLSVLTAGPGVAGPSNLLYSEHIANLLDRVRATFDMVVFDTPPMMQIPDARLLGKMTDGVVLVVRAGVTTRDAAVAARMRLAEDGVNFIGTVMNDWDPSGNPGGYYGYYGKYSTYHRYFRNE
jgi:capsular exopolysaccharide synthesis family protein